MTDFWVSWQSCKHSYVSLQRWWDRGKDRLKGIIIRFSRERSKKDSSARSVLSNLLDHLKRQIDDGRDSLLPVFENVKARIAHFDSIAAEGARVRSRVKWAEEGETSSRYFLRLEKKRGASDWISAMKSPDDSVVSEFNAICDSWVDFYSSLFSVSPVDLDCQNDLLNNLTSFLSSEQSALCEGPLSACEVFEALKGMASRI